VNNLARYKKIRSKIKTGDVIAFQGNDSGAKLIRKFTESEYSHVGLAIHLKDELMDRVFILESVLDAGVVLFPLSKKLRTYKGKAWWCPLNFGIKRIKLKTSKLKMRKRCNIITWGMNEIGKKYDFKHIGRIAKRILTKGKKTKREDYQQYICSELVGAVLKSQGLLPIDIATESMTPKDVVNLDLIKSQELLI